MKARIGRQARRREGGHVPSILITGSNRGLGLEWVRQCARDGWRVLASCRHPAEASEIRQLAEQNDNVSLHRLDVTNAEDIRAVCGNCRTCRLTFC